MDVLKDLWSKDFVSALLGALVGGVATFVVAMYQARKSLEALRIQGNDARELAKDEREAVQAREAGMAIMDLLLTHRADLQKHGTDPQWLEDQAPVIDRIRSYARVLPEGRHRELLLEFLVDLKRKRPENYSTAEFKQDKIKMTNGALHVIGGHMNGDEVTRSPEQSEIRNAWDKASQEAYQRTIAVMDNNPLPDDWEDSSTPVLDSASPSA
ncbi:hypothetical protein OG780_19740 [Streptomyces sp. NBC_00386]|uniref:hypothetical protein n=1 Tax=Streptomyces sp. NBC_00386 TaxID=2975734 RepID=UPI002E24F6DA